MKRTRPLGLFARLSKGTSRLAGRPTTFVVIVLLVLAWAITGPIYDYSNTWQLVINTATTIVTFLMVFLIQATQNRDSDALHLKLDEIIRALEGAHNAMIDSENLDDEDLARIQKRYLELAERARTRIDRGKPDTGVPDIQSD
jgi:low affinity Fe/Cu permease